MLEEAKSSLLVLFKVEKGARLITDKSKTIIITIIIIIIIGNITMK